MNMDAALGRESQPKAGSPLIFVHIPRSGGATIDDVLIRQYGRKHVFQLYVRTGQDTEEAWTQFTQMDEGRRNRLISVQGHFNYGSIDQFYEAPRYITVLRHPVARLVSYYQYALGNRKHYLHQLICRHKMSARDLILSRSSIELDNCTTRQLCGRKDVPIGGCNEEMLEAACHNLEHGCTAFGITELFDETLILFKRRFGWKSEPYWITLAGARDRRSQKKHSPALVEAITEMNALDLRLYEFARGLFERTIAAEGHDFVEEVSRFKRKNKLVQPIARAYRRYAEWSHARREALRPRSAGGAVESRV